MTRLRLGPERAGQRLDKALQSVLQEAGHQLSASQVRQELRSGRLKVDGGSQVPGSQVQGHETVDVTGWLPAREAPVAPRADLLASVPVVAQAPSWVVFDKPAGLPTLPGPPPHGPSLLAAAGAFDAHILAAGPPAEGGCVHRLDNGASGAVLFARSPQARTEWRHAFGRHRVEKSYLADCVPQGDRDWFEGLALRISGQIQTTGGPRVRFRPGPGPESRVTVRRVEPGRVIAQVETRTGQRHQVRVHLAALGLPIRDDPLYGPDPRPEARRDPFRLHAWRLLWAGVDVRTGLPPWEGL